MIDEDALGNEASSVISVYEDIKIYRQGPIDLKTIKKVVEE